MIDVFIPSYHRADNLKTVKFLEKIDYDMKHVYVFIDDEADDRERYKAIAKQYGFHLVVFDMTEARKRFDYVHRASVSRRSAGQARNMFQDYAKKKGIERYVVMDDDTKEFQFRVKGVYMHTASGDTVKRTFEMIAEMMRRQRIGLFGVSQTGDFYGSLYLSMMRRQRIGLFGVSQTGDFYGSLYLSMMRRKVMNVTFYDTRFIYRGERGVQDDDTSQFTGVLNEGLFTGSLADGINLQQTVSATAKGGLTDLYNECKLYNKAMVTPIQYPSAIRAERQVMNGGRIHHRIDYRYLAPKLMKGERNNIAWDTYPEDYPFTNEPKRERGNV